MTWRSETGKSKRTAEIFICSPFELLRSKIKELAAKIFNICPDFRDRHFIVGLRKVEEIKRFAFIGDDVYGKNGVLMELVLKGRK